jgi:TPR repeat protein
MDAHYASHTNMVLTECDRLASAPWDPDAPVHAIAPKFQSITTEAIAACRTATESDPTIRRFWFQLGRAYDKNKQYNDAAKAYEKAVRMESTSAMVNLGILYELGNGIRADQIRARGLYERSARAGNSEGMYCFATALDNGIGGSVNIESAKEWYTKTKEAEYANTGAKAALDKLQSGVGPSGFRCGF